MYYQPQRNPQVYNDEILNEQNQKNLGFSRDELQEQDEQTQFDSKYQQCLFKCGQCCMCFGTYCPYNILVGKTSYNIQQGFAGVHLRFGKYMKTTSAGFIQINPYTDTLYIVDCRSQLIEQETLSAITKDNLQIKVNASVYIRIFEPKKMICNVYNPVKGINELTLASLTNVIGAFTFQDLLEKREQIQKYMEDFSEGYLNDWGIMIEAIILKDIQVDDNTKNIIAQVATEKRSAQAKLLSAQSYVESAKLIKESADILNSKASMQVRYLEVLGNIGNENQTKVVIM